MFGTMFVGILCTESGICFRTGVMSVYSITYGYLLQRVGATPPSLHLYIHHKNAQKVVEGFGLIIRMREVPFTKCVFGEKDINH